MEEQSDDEIFFGKLTLKEIKKIYGVKSDPGSYSENKDFHNITEPNDSIKIIETHSQPNLRADEEEHFYSNPGSPALGRESLDDSFIKLENKVTELCMDPRTSDNVELNNTLEVIDYILNNGPKLTTEHATPTKADTHKSDEQIKDDSKDSERYFTPLKNETEIEDNSHKLLIIIQENSNTDTENKKSLSTTHKELSQQKTPLKDTKIKHLNTEQIKIDSKDSEQYYTPAQNEKKKQVATSSVKKPHVFKTPGPQSNKKIFTPAKSPNRTNAYQHIASPIASYIKNCPQVPLVKDVHPKKPLPGPSSIPKFVKSQPVKSQNKENIDLPKVAYKSAKKTVLINVDQEKLPQSQWAKSTLPRPKVVKHEKREMNPLKVLAKQEESFENLSCLQAEVSVCTQKTAFKPVN